jgi:hypothetical protein
MANVPCVPASRGSAGPDGLDSRDLRAMRGVTDKLLGLLATSGRSNRDVAASAGVSPSTVSRWGTHEVVPRIGHLAAIGLELDVRLQWSPLDPEWPGASMRPRARPPKVEDWWGGGAGRRHLTAESANGVTPAYLAALLGAEVRWWRLTQARLALEAMPGANPKTWADFENGPERDWFKKSKPRVVKSAPLTTAVYIGRKAGLSLEWAPLGSPWRVPPWVVAGPPGRVRTPNTWRRSFLMKK